MDEFELMEMQDIYARLHSKKELIDIHRPLPEMVVNRIKDGLVVEWTYNSNSIEGNTFSLGETKIVLENGMTISGKSLKEHFEVFNHSRAIDFLYSIVNDSYKLTANDVLSVHGLVMNNVDPNFAGRFRNAGVRITGANFVPPNARRVQEMIDELVYFVTENPKDFNCIELATLFHHKFVWIHPFFDGNGRTVRLVMNLLLMQQGYPPAIILKNDRKKYYEALNQANKGKYQKLLLLMCQAVERSLNIYIQALPDMEEDYLPITNLLEEEKMPYGQEYISLLARTGKIDAYKEGRNWVTTKKAVDVYRESRKRNR